MGIVNLFRRALERYGAARTTDYRRIRWGIDAEPDWVDGDKVTAPPAGTVLVSKLVPTGKTGYIFGFFLSVGEANDFDLNYTSGGVAKSLRIIFGGKGTLHFTDVKEMCKSDGGSTVSITNVNAGSTGIIYQARLLYAEV
ncbi:MAG: hypothetical protein QXP83_07895 [Candidatus Nezhaarchaeales archaeon]